MGNYGSTPATSPEQDWMSIIADDINNKLDRRYPCWTYPIPPFVDAENALNVIRSRIGMVVEHPDVYIIRNTRILCINMADSIPNLDSIVETHAKDVVRQGSSDMQSLVGKYVVRSSDCLDYSLDDLKRQLVEKLQTLGWETSWKRVNWKSSEDDDTKGSFICLTKVSPIDILYVHE